MPHSPGWRRGRGPDHSLQRRAFPDHGAARPRRHGRLEGGLLAGCLLAAFVPIGCGPSFEVLAEGDLRFVHCDRLDLDPNIAPSHRLHCWREWRRMYTYGQTRDRVEYAQRRIAEVVSGDTDPPFQLPAGATTVARHSLQHAPEHAAAPRLEAVPGLPAAASADAVVSSDPSLAVGAPSTALVACHSRCEAASASCLPGCETRPTGCKPCDTPLEACLRGCQAKAQ